MIYTKEQPVHHVYINSYGDTIAFIFLSIIHQSIDLFPGIQYVVCNHYSLVPQQQLNYRSYMQNILIINKLTHRHSIILYTKEHWSTHDMWLVPDQDVHFFYTRSHLSALQNCALIFSTNLQFIFTFKKCTTQFNHWIV